MLIWERSLADAAELRRIAAGVADDSELFVRDGGGGSVILSAAGSAHRVPAEAKQATVLFTGGKWGPDAGDWLFLVGLWTPTDYRNEFLAWYKIEHMPILLECPIWDGCRFVEQQQVAGGCQFFALHQLADKAALDSAERKGSRATPWFQRLSRNDWFDGKFTRTLYRRLPDMK